MAERRMFTQKIIDSDAFLDMPLSSQALYFHLNMRADDDGFINNPKRIQRTVGASDDDLKLLLAKRFVIGFASGVLVIKHWRMHNALRKDRYSPTQYQEEFAMLEVKDNKAYTERLPELQEPNAETVATTWQPHGNHLAPQYSIGKDSIDKGSIEDNTPPDSDESEQSTTMKPKKGKSKAKKDAEELAMKVCELMGKNDYSLFAEGTPELQNAIVSFVEFRKGIKKPMTDHAIDLLIQKLNSMTNNIWEQIEIINQSIMNGWQGVFPLKDKTQQQPIKQPSYQKQSKADELDDFYRMAGDWANQ